jgi:hypothetical protein
MVALREGTKQPAANLPASAFELRSVVTGSVLQATANQPNHITALSIKPILRPTRHFRTISNTHTPRFEAAHHVPRQQRTVAPDTTATSHKHKPTMASDPEREHALEEYKKTLLDSREWEAKLKALRLDIKGLQHDYDVSEDNIKALQSVGQIIGEVLKQLDEERCEFAR